MIHLNVITKKIPHGKEFLMYVFLSMEDIKWSSGIFLSKKVIEMYLVLLDRFF
jgi:hypothetical protein